MSHPLFLFIEATPKPLLTRNSLSLIEAICGTKAQSPEWDVHKVLPIRGSFFVGSGEFLWVLVSSFG